jgi:hypothetical protein
MRRSCMGIAGALLAVSLAGCSESSEEGPISYKGTDSPAIQEQLKVMSENVKNKSITTKATDDKSAAKKDKDAEKKPAADAGADKKK